MASTWTWDSGRSFREYPPFAQAILNENYAEHGLLMKVKLKLDGRDFVVRRGKKGWVQEVASDKTLWRAVERKAYDGAA